MTEGVQVQRVTLGDPNWWTFWRGAVHYLWIGRRGLCWTAIDVVEPNQPAIEREPTEEEMAILLEHLLSQ